MCFRKIVSFFKKKPLDEPLSKPSREEKVNTLDNDITNDTIPSNMGSNIEPEVTEVEGQVLPEFEYLYTLIRYRLSKYFPSENQHFSLPNYNISNWQLPLADFIKENNLSEAEALLLLIGIIPHIQPHLIDQAIESVIPLPNGPTFNFSKIGGVRGNNSRFFLPTGETVLFLLTDDELSKRKEVQLLFGAEHIFWEKKIVWLEDLNNAEPAMNGRLIISPDYVDLFIYGTHQSPQFSISFPAKKIAPLKSNEQSNSPTLDDIVLPDELIEQVNELKSWIKYNEILMRDFGMRDRLKKGYRALFFGPPGTGKTFTAEILGNELKRDVYKIDLSMVVSKYIGETEKNLELLFARAEDKEWILFFDEADALFGKRTNVREAHDKYANQEVSYLLQRIEDYNGLVILATNMKNNIDDAFIRRFNSILKFPFPDQSQRALIWRKSLPKNAAFRRRAIAATNSGISEESVDIPDAVKKYELTGGSIINVVQYASIKAVEALYSVEKVGQNQPELADAHAVSEKIKTDPKINEKGDPKLVIYLSDILEGIKRELTKEGKPFSL